MADEDVPSLPTAQQKILGEFEVIARMWVAMAKNAAQIAETRKALFDAYRASGFTEPQALELVKGSLIL